MQDRISYLRNLMLTLSGALLKYFVRGQKNDVLVPNAFSDLDLCD